MTKQEAIEIIKDMIRDFERDEFAAIAHDNVILEKVSSISGKVCETCLKVIKLIDKL